MKNKREMREKVIQQLRRMCDETEKTTKVIAKEMHVAESTLRRWLKGDCDMKLGSAIKVVEYFHCSLQYLIDPRDLPSED